MEIKNLTRRSFVKAALATGALATVGCSSDDGNTVYVDRNVEYDYTNPPNLSAKYDRVAPATSPHNCGGGCMMLAYVKDDVIVGIGADETTPDLPIIDRKTGNPTFADLADYPRSIPCIRCRAHKSLMYDANRLLYPMIQRGERGDINGFEKVSWDDALEYMFDKIKTIRANYGPGAFMQTQTTGAGGFTTANFSTLTGTYPSYRVNWSFYAYSQTMPFICGGPSSVPNASWAGDSTKSDYLIVWGHNIADNVQGAESMYRLTQIKESGVKVKVIDTWQCTTASTVVDDMAEDMYAIPPGTDTALIIGIIHTMLTKYYAELKTLWGATTDEDLWKNVGKLLYGFFDQNETPGKITTAGGQRVTDFNTYYQVPPGGSFSAYIFGNSDKLIAPNKDLNKGKSIYPNHIRYNVWDHSDDRCFPAADAKTFCYGQVEKDSTWASKITGISKERIEELAEIFVKNDVSVWCGYAINRNTEGDSEVWATMMLMAISRCFGGLSHGIAGHAGKCRTWGVSRDPKYAAPSAGGTGWTNNAGTYGASISNTDIDKFKVNGGTAAYKYLTDSYGYPNMYDDNLCSLGSDQPRQGRSGISCFAVMDAVKATNKPKITDPIFGNQVYPSEQNDGQVKNRYVPLKGLFNTAGGQPVNQYGDVNKNIEILTMKDVSGTDAYTKNCHPQKYALELFVVADPMFTSTALWADVLLPTAMSYEREDVGSGGFGGGQNLRMTRKVHEPLGEALDERYINGKFAGLYGKEAEYYNTYVDPVTKKDTQTGETFEEKLARRKYESSSTASIAMPYDVFRQKGIVNAKMVVDAGGSLPDAYAGHLDAAASAASAAFLTSITSAGGVTNRSTATGKFEAYCVSMVDDYRARYNNNVDDEIDLVLTAGATAITAKSIAVTDRGKGMFVYPVPMYVPLPEGIHANGEFKTVADGNTDGIAHPDPLNLKNQGFTKYVCTYHPMYRCHSTHSNNPLVTDFYKKNNKGGDAYIDYGTDRTKLTDLWKDGVYEPVFTNEDTTYSDTNEKVKNGDVVIIESKTGKVKVVVQISNNVRANTIFLPQGAWNMIITDPVHGKVDVGGNVNSLTSHRQTRISHGPAVSNDVRVKIVKSN